MVKKTIVRLSRVSKLFTSSHHPALQNITCEIASGEITGIVGPDGAGKTTLIRLLVGLLEPNAGKVFINGKNPVKHQKEIHQIIGYMPQKFGLYEELSVIENLRLYADLRQIGRTQREQKFNELLHFTQLEQFTNRLASQLSGGMKQKLGLACALMGTPKLLLLDEPSVGVDPISRRELWNMVNQLLSTDLSVVWSTSYLDEAERCHNVLLLNEGNLLYQGSPKKFLEKMESRTWHVCHVKSQDKRRVLMHLQQQKEVIDGVIQGKNIRIVLGNPLHRPPLQQGTWIEVAPCFEDAYINALGGGSSGYSELANSMQEKPKTEKPIIQAENLMKKFGDFTAVQNNNFNVHRGEIFGLLGPNGAGKTTTFKMMCGLLQPTEGCAMVAGLDLRTATSKARSRIGYMAQKFSLYGNLNMKENLYFFSSMYGLTKKQQKIKIHLMIKLFDLRDYLHMRTSVLPLGFKQRLALACAIMHEPDVLFLDEPTSGVDPVTRREFWTHINAMTERGITVMVTTHFMDEAEYCDRIGLIYKGKNIATGTPDTLKDRIKSNTSQDPTLEDAFIQLIKQYDISQAEMAV